MLAIVDHRIPEDAKRALLDLGYRVLPLPTHPALPTPVGAHPDMLLFFSPDGIFCTKSYQTIAESELEFLSSYTKKPIRSVENEVSGNYPNDILLNAAPVGKHLFCLAKHTAKELTAHGFYEVASVRQGYAKCSVVPVGERALITEDPSIARVALQKGLDVLRVCSNAVALSGYDTGFLGGASSYAPDLKFRKILFCGNLDLHPDADAIKAFCVTHGFDPISLSSNPLVDVGTIFLLPMGES